MFISINKNYAFLQDITQNSKGQRGTLSGRDIREIAGKHYSAFPGYRLIGSLFKTIRINPEKAAKLLRRDVQYLKKEIERGNEDNRPLFRDLINSLQNVSEFADKEIGDFSNAISSLRMETINDAAVADARGESPASVLEIDPGIGGQPQIRQGQGNAHPSGTNRHHQTHPQSIFSSSAAVPGRSIGGDWEEERGSNPFSFSKSTRDFSGTQSKPGPSAGFTRGLPGTERQKEDSPSNFGKPSFKNSKGSRPTQSTPVSSANETDPKKKQYHQLESLKQQYLDEVLHLIDIDIMPEIDKMPKSINDMHFKILKEGVLNPSDVLSLQIAGNDLDPMKYTDVGLRTLVGKLQQIHREAQKIKSGTDVNQLPKLQEDLVKEISNYETLLMSKCAKEDFDLPEVIADLNRRVFSYQADKQADKILGIPQTASKQEIDRAFKRISLFLHPDKRESRGIDGDIGRMLWEIVSKAKTVMESKM